MSDSTQDMFVALSVCSIAKKNKAVSISSPDVAVQELDNSLELSMGNVLKNCFNSDVLKPIPNN